MFFLQMPIYHVLEQEKPAAIATTESATTRQFPTNEIPVDENAPPIPVYNPDSGNVPAVENPKDDKLFSSRYVC